MPEQLKYKFTAVGLDVATILFSLMLFGNGVHLFGSRRAEMADLEQIKKIIPFVTCEMSFGQDAQRVAVWCSMYANLNRWNRSRLLLSNNVNAVAGSVGP